MSAPSVVIEKQMGIQTTQGVFEHQFTGILADSTPISGGSFLIQSGTDASYALLPPSAIPESASLVLFISGGFALISARRHSCMHLSLGGLDSKWGSIKQNNQPSRNRKGLSSLNLRILATSGVKPRRTPTKQTSHK
jgi:hypothetical protein